MQETSEMLGAFLKQSREAKNMTLATVAERLKLSQSKIKALEADDAAIMQSDIARGYLRSYARLLEIDAQQLLDTHARLFPQQRADIHVTTEALQKSVNRQRKVKKTMRLLVFSGSFIVLALCAIYFWSEFIPVSAPEPSAQAQAENQGPGSENNPVDKEQLVAEVSGQTDQPEKSTELANQTGPLKQGQIEIKLVFSEQSWTSVRDAQGKSIYNKLADANTQEVVSGYPPLKLIIGNANGTKLYAHGSEVSLAKYSENNVARLNLE